MDPLNVSRVHTRYCENSFSQHHNHLDQRCLVGLPSAIYANHGVLIDKFFDVELKDNDTLEQESCGFELLGEPSIGDNDVLPVAWVSLPCIKKKYFWFSMDCGNVRNLVFQNSWQQDKDVVHNGRSNEYKFLFSPDRITWVRVPLLSPWRLIFLTPVRVSYHTSLRFFSSTYEIHPIAFTEYEQGVQILRWGEIDHPLYDLSCWCCRGIIRRGPCSRTEILL